jgi:hypothetical protein
MNRRALFRQGAALAAAATLPAVLQALPAKPETAYRGPTTRHYTVLEPIPALALLAGDGLVEFIDGHRFTRFRDAAAKGQRRRELGPEAWPIMLEAVGSGAVEVDPGLCKHLDPASGWKRFDMDDAIEAYGPERALELQVEAEHGALAANWGRIMREYD